jgi:heterodisulfide reductase subunit B
MKYSYYPGCSLHSAHKGYDLSCRAALEALGCELIELEDWNCCGATIYMSIKKITSLAIATRNLALAEKAGMDIVTPCSSCYTVLNKAHRHVKESQELLDKVNTCLAEAGLEYNCTVRIRKKPLDGLKIANYYGCQIVRPEKGFDDNEDPTSMENLFETIGGENVYYPCKLRCCGGMLMTTYEDAARKLSSDLLERAVENGAECIATTCPLCQMNLEAYQDKINKTYNTNYKMPILFFTQILGVALGLDEQQLGIDKNFYSCDKLDTVYRSKSILEAV